MIYRVLKEDIQPNNNANNQNNNRNGSQNNIVQPTTQQQNNNLANKNVTNKGNLKAPNRHIDPVQTVSPALTAKANAIKKAEDNLEKARTSYDQSYKKAEELKNKQDADKAKKPVAEMFISKIKFI